MNQVCLFTLLDATNRSIDDNNYYLVVGGCEVYYGSTVSQCRRYATSKLPDSCYIEIRMLGSNMLIMAGTVAELYGRTA